MKNQHSAFTILNDYWGPCLQILKIKPCPRIFVIIEVVLKANYTIFVKSISYEYFVYSEPMTAVCFPSATQRVSGLNRTKQKGVKRREEHA